MKCIHPPLALLVEYFEIKVVIMAKISVEIPQHILDDLQKHIGSDKKFLNLSEAIRSALRKLLDQLDEIDRQAGRNEGD